MFFTNILYGLYKFMEFPWLRAPECSGCASAPAQHLPQLSQLMFLHSHSVIVLLLIRPPWSEWWQTLGAAHAAQLGDFSNRLELLHSKQTWRKCVLPFVPVCWKIETFPLSSMSFCCLRQLPVSFHLFNVLPITLIRNFYKKRGSVFTSEMVLTHSCFSASCSSEITGVKSL